MIENTGSMRRNYIESLGYTKLIIYPAFRRKILLNKNNYRVIRKVEVMSHKYSFLSNDSLLKNFGESERKFVPTRILQNAELQNIKNSFYD